MTLLSRIALISSVVLTLQARAETKSDFSALLAYDAALKADAEGYAKPAAAAAAWKGLAEAKGENPYLEKARDRQQFWTDYAVKIREVSLLVNLGSVSVSEKRSAIADLSRAFGPQAALVAVEAIKEEPARREFCERVDTYLPRVSVQVTSINTAGKHSPARVFLNSSAVGVTPFSRQVAVCIQRLGVSEIESGAWLEQKLSLTADSPPFVYNAAFRAVSISEHFANALSTPRRKLMAGLGAGAVVLGITGLVLRSSASSTREDYSMHFADRLASADRKETTGNVALGLAVLSAAGVGVLTFTGEF